MFAPIARERRHCELRSGGTMVTGPDSQSNMRVDINAAVRDTLDSPGLGPRSTYVFLTIPGSPVTRQAVSVWSER